MDSGRAPCVSRDAVEDLIRGPGPDEGFGVLVMHAYVLADGGFQLFDTSENAAPNAFVGEFGQPAFHQVDPGSIGGPEMDMKARSLGKPFPYDRLGKSSAAPLTTKATGRLPCLPHWN